MCLSICNWPIAFQKLFLYTGFVKYDYQTPNVQCRMSLLFGYCLSLNVDIADDVDDFDVLMIHNDKDDEDLLFFWLDFFLTENKSDVQLDTYIGRVLAINPKKP